MRPDERSRDDGSAVSDWAGDVLVACPACAARAVVTPAPDPPARRLVCPACGLTRSSPGTRSVWGEPVDPWFGCALWLTAPFRGHTVWAYDGAHAARLRDFVTARVRERGPAPATGSMVERLPAWFKAAGNRDALVAILDGFVERAAAPPA